MKANAKKNVLRRLSLIRGQINGLIKMVENERYCIDIITQSSAIKEALSGVQDVMLENHLTTHVIHQIKNGESKKATAEILKMYKLAQKKK
ncbi:metal-sensitive transcriptional regulator [Candidatus Parcubacteria bacterium]|nr:MAG: metal-sensitive transcriptional regulator [Candidatus Parcubacteria bacterium]